MKAGFCSVDITPAPGVPIGGNVRDDNVSKGTHDPLKADIVVFGNGECTAVLIDMDWVGTLTSVFQRIRQTIADECAVSRDHICVSMTHTHSGPDVYPVVRQNKFSAATLQYIDETIPKLVSGVNAALQRLRTVRIGWGKTYEYGISFNRRLKMKDGSLKMNFEFIADPDLRLDDVERMEGTIDPEVNILKISDGDGLLGVIVNFTLHPAVLVGRDFLFSKDVVWGLEETLRKWYGEHLFVYFANGALGDTNHIDIRDRGQSSDWAETYRIGEVLGNAVLSVLDDIPVYDTNVLNVTSRTLPLPIRSISEQELQAARTLWDECGGTVPELFHGVPDEWYAGDVLEMAKENRATEEVSLQVLRLGDAVVATLPCELFAEHGMRLKKESGAEHTVLFGIANQYVGYVPTPEAIRNGGMEGRTCHFSRFAPEAGDRIVDTIVEMINDMTEG